MSRRTLLEAGACALAGAVVAPVASAGEVGASNASNEALVRRWYAAWGNKDLDTFNALLADNFTFTSPVPGDDHISKSTFKTRCWDTQIDFIGSFELEALSAGPDDAFVRYLCHTKNGKAFRNVEYLRLKNGQLQSIECYFGGQSNFPSAVSKG
jgi:ketosteroid isomerase-like protein